MVHRCIESDGNERESFGLAFDRMEAFLTSLDPDTDIPKEVTEMLRQQMMHVTHSLRLTEALKKKLKQLYLDGKITDEDASRLAVITHYDVKQACRTSAIAPRKKRD